MSKEYTAAVRYFTRSQVNKITACYECGEFTPVRCERGDLLGIKMEALSPRAAKTITVVLTIHEKCLLTKLGIVGEVHKPLATSH